MSFVILVVVLMWLVVWPIVWYAYFKNNTHSAQPDRRSITQRDVALYPSTEGHETKVSMRIGDTFFYLSQEDARAVGQKIHAAQLTVRSMNEVQGLGQR